MSEIATLPRRIEPARSAAQIARALRALLAASRRFAEPGRDEVLDALVQIAARQGEILRACLDAAPERHIAAFSELLAIPPRPAAAARVYLSFTAAPGLKGVVVPMHTPVAAAAPGQAEPVVFETDEDLLLADATPAQAWHADAGHTTLQDVGRIMAPATEGHPAPAPGPVAQALHLAAPELFEMPGLREISLQVELESTKAAAPEVPWECGIQTPKGFQPLSIVQDGTAGLKLSGEIRLLAPDAWPLTPVGGFPARWLTLRVRPGRPAVRLKSLQIQARAVLAARKPEAACQGQVPLDASKDFHPFGERPRFGDTFLCMSDVYAVPGARVEMQVQLNNPDGAVRPPIPAVDEGGKPVLGWEILTAEGYRPLVMIDGTRSFVVDGTLSFTVPNDVAPAPVAGKNGVWLRARLARGDWGSVPGHVEVEPPTPRAPSVRSISIQATLERGPVQPQALVREEALALSPLTLALGRPQPLYAGPDVDGAALYLAFAGTFEGAPEAHGDVCLQVEVPPGAATARPDGAAPLAAPVWQARTAAGWSLLQVKDGTLGFTRSGIVRLTLQAAPAPWPASTLPRAGKLRWLRVVWPADHIPGLPARIHANAVAATQTQQVRNELLGSSLGRAGQSFGVLRKPVIGPVSLEVREAGGAWVGWTEVADFAASQSIDRHYTLDRQSGLLRFGDGQRGRIPEPGPNNVRLARYAFGGGAQGNCPAGTVSQLRRAVPGVMAVTNPEPAQGGLDAESPAHVRAHASAWIRHRGQAVCADDYADLALRASPEVARAHCHAGRDLGLPGAASLEARPGVLSLVVIPHSALAMPQPSPELLAGVSSYLQARRLAAGRLVLVGPRYAAVSVEAEVEVSPGCSAREVVMACKAALAAFLHPVNGGSDGRGWISSRRPHRSMLVALLARVEGVEAVRRLHLSMSREADDFHVVAAGELSIQVCQ